MFTVLQRHVSTHTFHLQARTIIVYKVTVLILGSQTLTCFFIDVIYCIIKKHGTDHSKYDKSGIYQLTCPDCKMKYTGQTGRPFRIRLQEHFRDFKY